MTTNEQEAKKWNEAGAKSVTAETVAAARAKAKQMGQKADFDARGVSNQLARFEAEIDGAAAARIAMWDACKGQVEYVRVLATNAAHYGNIALA